eukprot:s385_g22.t1
MLHVTVTRSSLLAGYLAPKIPKILQLKDGNFLKFPWGQARVSQRSQDTMALKAVAWITLLRAVVSDIAQSTQECTAESCPASSSRNAGSTFLQFTSRVRHTENTSQDDVTCGGCRALVKTRNFDRCKDYCESFGHSCVAAAEEEDENCVVKESYDCDEEFDDTSDMLCTCSKTPSAPCYSSLNGVVTDEGQSVGMARSLSRTSSMDECEKACNDKDGCSGLPWEL